MICDTCNIILVWSCLPVISMGYLYDLWYLYCRTCIIIMISVLSPGYRLHIIFRQDQDSLDFLILWTNSKELIMWEYYISIGHRITDENITIDIVNLLPLSSHFTPIMNNHESWIIISRQEKFNSSLLNSIVR